jgi:hypothetical protein
MVHKKRDKKAAMEMTVGTIVTIVLLMSALVLGLILTRSIFKSTTENVDTIDAQLKGEIQNLFGSEGKKLIIGLGGESTATIKQGTDSFGIPFGFAPRAWGANKDGCKYNIELAPTTSNKACTRNGWTSPKDNIFPGTANQGFDVDGSVGYALMKIDIPVTIPPCQQRFTILVKCNGYVGETTTSTFDINVIKKGLF